MATVKEVKEKHPGEWLAIEVTGEDDSGPVEGNLILHGLDHDMVWDKIAGDRRRIYVTYAGSPIEKGYAVAF